MSTAKPDAYLIPVNPDAPATVFGGLDVASLWTKGRAEAKQGATRTFYDAHDGASVTLASLGKDFKPNRDEAVRRATGAGIKAVQEAGAKVVHVDVAGSPHAAAQGVQLGKFHFTLKTAPDAKKPEPIIVPVGAQDAGQGGLSWETGLVYAECQNLARELMELPANMMTPTIFCERVAEEFQGLPNVDIVVRDTEWARSKNMNSFVSVTKGTAEPAKFLEIHYKGGNPSDKPIVWVGKGVTFDAGGINIKVTSDMHMMRGDMGGAANVVSAALGVAKLKLPINLIVLTPLTENLPGPSASKPGDIVYASNGKTIEINNTDAEGRLILADALYYGSSTFKPDTIIDVATLTGAIMVALGGVYSGVFSSSDELWKALYTAGEAEFDRFWRMPLNEAYGPAISGSNADLCNTGGRWGGACTAAWFLRAFVDGIDEGKISWAHIDIPIDTESSAYERKGSMAGRPTRALIEFARRAALNQTS
ncbi:hypothetical protein EXIGLDRAFT_777292 [Exidia glandulosa HHB12029]|uniref:Cytosol aminopeptidase domain-containing protein n=1 Tax=Exidia glandulosa HHB12029 TaxID=1314781 RepID=A0A165D3A4_EXIGL|nr:hypothetical protein EXIGLDRAFT_777292 [Exidia glandulosa HHB12029]